jgi:hypothetical protein
MMRDIARLREEDLAEVSKAVRSQGQGAETDPDAALRFAIKVAVDAGQYDRAMKLLDVLRATTTISRA